MKLEQQVCSLELAKRLKDAGAKQESLFYWFTNQLVYRCDLSKWEKSKKYIFSAFTVAELGEMLPFNVKTNKIGDSGKWFARHFIGPNNSMGDGITADTEADARAKMLICLIEQGLVKP